MGMLNHKSSRRKVEGEREANVSIFNSGFISMLGIQNQI
jgi:hypothetical protein